MTATAKFTNTLPPRTAMEVFETLPQGTLAEVIDNTLYIAPSPSFDHQDIADELCGAIRAHVKAMQSGRCVSAPQDVYLDSTTVVQPDIIFVASNNLGILKNSKVRGVPDILVEVLSTNRKHDLEKKKGLYEKFGVKEYFIVDPDTKETITYYHDGKKYIQQESKKGKIKSKLLKKTFSF